MIGARRAVLTALAWFVVLPVLAPATAAGSGPIDLGDVVAGGDGSGNAPAANTGIDPRNGRFVTSYIDGPISEGDAVADGRNPSPTVSRFIDSVFFITERSLPGGTGIDPITQSGVVYGFLPGDGVPPPGFGWNYILADRNGGASTAPVRVGGVVLSTAVGVHSSMGVTFDLDALRAAHGAASVGCFETYWGLDDCSGADVELYAILSNDTAGPIDARSARFVSGQGAFMDPLEIPPAARYLTLATGSRGIDACDHGTFGRAWISASPCAPPSPVAILSVSPGIVPTAGGTSITLSGEGFTSGLQAFVGGLPLSGVTVPDPGHLRGRTPALAAGLHTVEVSTAAGGVLASLPDAVEAVAGPSITSVEPSDVNRDGTTAISIHGEGFAAGAQVKVGGRDLASPSVVSPTLITGLAPALPAAESDGPRDVSVEGPLGNGVLPGGVVYFTAEQVSILMVMPSFVSTAGGTSIEISGNYFAPGMVARLGGVPLVAQEIPSSSLIRGTSPPLPPGFHAAEITDAGGAVLARLERAVEAGTPLAITGVEPRRVQRNGSTAVSIHGSGFSAATAIHIGTHPLAGKRVVSPSLITGSAPALAAAELDGPRDVVAEDTRSSVTFTGGVHYVSPAVKTLSFTERFAPGDLTLTPITMPDGTHATRVTLRGSDSAAAVGEPALPVVYRRVVVPRGALVVDVESNPGPQASYSGHSMIEWQNPLQPAQAADRVPHPPEASEGPDGPLYNAPPEPVDLDASVLTAPAWPQEAAAIDGVVELDEFQLVTCRLSPVRWKPAEAKLELLTSLDVTVWHEGGAAPDPATSPNYRQAIQREELRSLVVNPQVVPATSDVAVRRALDVPYVIITDNEVWKEDMTVNKQDLLYNHGDMVQEFQRLADWKTQRGVKTLVVTVKEIVTGRYGDFTTGARDLQEAIRNFLRYAKESWRTYWVLLGGDERIIPYRRAPVYLRPVAFKQKSSPALGEAYLNANNGLIRIHSDAFLRESERAYLYHAGSGNIFRKVTNPHFQNPGWTFMDSTYSQESSARTEYLLVAGVPLGQIMTQTGVVFIPPADLYLADWNSRVPTDLYYASVNGDWDGNGNGIFGEVLGDTALDGAGFWPDLALGRAPFIQAGHVNSWVFKVLRYEQAPLVHASSIALAATNFTGGGKLLPYGLNPPPMGYYFYANFSTEARLHFPGTPGLNAWQFAIIKYKDEQSYVTIPYDRSPSGTKLGYYFCTDESYSQISEYNSSVPKPTEWVRVRGPEDKINLCNFQCPFFFDDPAPDPSVLEKEEVKSFFDTHFPAPDYSYRRRTYEDAKDAPAWPTDGGKGLSVLVDNTLDPKDGAVPILQDFNLASLSGHGTWKICCGLGVKSLQYLRSNSGLAYADCCFTARIEVPQGLSYYWDEYHARIPPPFLSSRTLEFNAPHVEGGVAWVGNTSSSWVGLGHNFEMLFWKQILKTRRPGQLLNTKAFLTTTGYQKWANYSLSLLGDPEMPLWVKPPGTLKVDYKGCFDTKGDPFEVRVADANDQPISHAVVCLTRLKEIVDWHWTASNGKAVFDTSSWPAFSFLTLTVTADDFLPFEGVASTDVCSSSEFYRGDANGDLQVDLSDAIFTLSFLFQGGLEPACLDAADTNDDGDLDISDPVRLLNFLFLGAPPPPGFDPSHPGVDDTPDGLDCGV